LLAIELPLQNFYLLADRRASNERRKRGRFALLHHDNLSGDV